METKLLYYNLYQLLTINLFDATGVLRIDESVQVIVSSISAALLNSARQVSLFSILITRIGESSFQWPNERLGIYAGTIAITSNVTSTRFS